MRGLVKVRSYTAEPADLAAYGPVTDAEGRRRLTLQVMSAASGAAGSLICRIEGVADRDAAEALKGLRLYVERSALPDPAAEDEFYQADLIGLAAELPDGTGFGLVVAVHNHGAGDILEIERPEGRPQIVDVPFTRAAVPVVDLAGGRVVIDLPAGLLEPPTDTEAEAAQPPARPRPPRKPRPGGGKRT